MITHPIVHVVNNTGNRCGFCGKTLETPANAVWTQGSLVAEVNHYNEEGALVGTTTGPVAEEQVSMDWHCLRTT
jgi:hypothetical protein